jgi:hypothetical protein
VAFGERRSRLGVPSGAATAEGSSLSRLRSRAGFAGGAYRSDGVLSLGRAKASCDGPADSG